MEYIKDSKSEMKFECPQGHKDTYKLGKKELQSAWKEGWIPMGRHLVGCNDCEDFYAMDDCLASMSRGWIAF